jgi:hypothetical protein
MSALQALYQSMCGPAAPCAPLFTAGSIFVASFTMPPTEPDALAGIEIDADGAIESFKSSVEGGNQGDHSRWDGGCGILDIADYDFRYDVTIGSVNGISFTAGVWHPGSGGLINFSVTENLGVQTAWGTLRVRPAGGGADIDTITLTLQAERTP